MPLLNEFVHGLSHLLFPQLCEGCRAPLMIKLEDTLCLICNEEIAKTGFHNIPDNDAALRLAGRIPYQHITALAHFTPDGLLQHLLHGLKYKNKKRIGLFLGRQLAFELKQSDWLQTVDVVIPIPLHPKKEALRTYNQSALIAKGISEITGKTTDLRSLQRVRHTESQTKKSRQERVVNMNGAFVTKDTIALKGKHVLLIDDVLTTGATLEAAANALLQIPELTVSIATIALAEQ